VPQTRLSTRRQECLRFLFLNKTFGHVRLCIAAYGRNIGGIVRNSRFGWRVPRVDLRGSRAGTTSGGEIIPGPLPYPSALIGGPSAKMIIRVRSRKRIGYRKMMKHAALTKTTTNTMVATTANLPRWSCSSLFRDHKSPSRSSISSISFRMVCSSIPSSYPPARAGHHQASIALFITRYDFCVNTAHERQCPRLWLDWPKRRDGWLPAKPTPEPRSGGIQLPGGVSLRKTFILCEPLRPPRFNRSA